MTNQAGNHGIRHSAFCQTVNKSMPKGMRRDHSAYFCKFGDFFNDPLCRTRSKAGHSIVTQPDKQSAGQAHVLTHFISRLYVCPQHLISLWRPEYYTAMDRLFCLDNCTLVLQSLNIKGTQFAYSHSGIVQ